MGKRNVLIVVMILVLIAAGGFWWFTQQDAAMAEDATATPAPTAARKPAPPEPAPPAAPAKPAESDAVALQEEVLDKEKAEADDLAARAADLEEQVRDGEMILDAQAKNIAKLEAELKALGVKPAEPKKK